MKFEDAYRSENDRVHVRESLQNEIASRYAQKTAKQREIRKRWFVAIPTAAAAAAAVFVAVTVGVNADASKNAAPMAAESFYEEAVAEEPMAVPDAIMTADGMLYGANAVAEGMTDSGETDALPDTETASVDITNVPHAEDNSTKQADIQLKRAGEAGMAVTDGTWNYLLNPEDRTIEIIRDDETEQTVITLPDIADDARTRSEDGLLLSGDMLYLFGTVENFEAPEETEKRIMTVINVYALGDRKDVRQIAELTQSGAFASAQVIGDTIMINSIYTVKNGEKSERYAVLSEIAANGGTSFRAQRVTRRK